MPAPAERAFIFDMDGTLLDNMRFHTSAWMETIEALGQPAVDPAEWEQRTSGVPNRTIFAEMLGVHTDHVTTWVDRKEAAYRRLSSGLLEPLGGLHRFLTEALHGGIDLAMATGAGQANIDFNLEALDLTDFFPVIVGADDVSRGKPDPEVFLTAAQLLGLPPERCVVFEDAPLGIEAARRAGMKVVAFTTMLSAVDLGAIPGVELVADNFEQLDPASL
jgi:beta-phosphoglucomutase family hydrolase